MWTAYVAETRTGRVLDEFPVTGHSWAHALAYGDDATGSVTIPLEPPLSGGYDPRERLRYWVTGPWRFSVVLAYGPQAMWAGPYVDYSYDGDPALTLNAASIKKVLDRRIVVKPGYETKLDDPASDSKFGPASLQDIVTAMIGDATGKGASELPITFEPHEPQPTKHERNYLSLDLATYHERIEQITEVINGPDVVFVPVLSADLKWLTWRVRFGIPELRQRGKPHEFDYQANVLKIAVDYSGADMCNRVWVPGQAETTSEDERTKLPVGYATSDTWTTLGWPRLESVLNDHASAKEIDTLTAHAQRYLQDREKPVETWTLTVDGALPPTLGTWQVGDDVNVHVTNDHWLADGDYTRRITGFSGDATDIVSIDTRPVTGALQWPTTTL